MKISMVVNTTGLTGGIKVVFEYANRLQARGHLVTVVYPYALDGKAGLIPILKRIKFNLLPRPSWFDLQVPILRVPTLDPKYMPEADVVIATANQTADWVAKLPGQNYYLIQGYETWTRAQALVDQTWRLPLKKIVIANWLKDKAKTLGVEVEAVIPNGIDLQQFHPTPKPTRAVAQILLMAHPLAIKGTADAIQALKLVKQPFELVVFSHYKIDIPIPHQYIQNPKDLAKLYAQSDIYLYTAREDGFALTPLEAMACQTAVISTQVGAVPDYAQHNQSALLVEPMNITQISQAVEKLLQDPEFRNTIAKNGAVAAQSYTWDSSVATFEQCLQPNPPKVKSGVVDGLIVNYRTPALTNQAIDSLLKEPETNQCIVVDNSPLDNSLQKHWQNHPKVRIITSKENIGFGRANNLGAQSATAPYLFLLNSDAAVESGCLKRLIQTLEQNPQAGLVAPQVLCPDGLEQMDAQGVFPTPWNLITQQSKHITFSSTPDWLSGVSLLTKTAIFQQVKGFDPDYFMYFEDIALCTQLQKAGYTLIKDRVAKVVHQGGSSFQRQTNRQKKQVYMEAQELYLSKQGTAKWIRYLICLLRWLKQGIWVTPR